MGIVSDAQDVPGARHRSRAPTLSWCTEMEAFRRAGSFWPGHWSHGRPPLLRVFPTRRGLVGDHGHAVLSPSRVRSILRPTIVFSPRSFIGPQNQTMSSGDENFPVRACPAVDETADAGRAAKSVPSCFIPAETSGLAAASEDTSSEAADEQEGALMGQACSICGYRKRFSHDDHNARTRGPRIQHCASGPSALADFRAEVFLFISTIEKSTTFSKSSVYVFFFLWR